VGLIGTTGEREDMPLVESTIASFASAACTASTIAAHAGAWVAVASSDGVTTSPAMRAASANASRVAPSAINAMRERSCRSPNANGNAVGAITVGS
jgi:hypothetical protein